MLLSLLQYRNYFFLILKRCIYKSWIVPKMNLKSNNFIHIIEKTTVEIDQKKVRHIWKEMIWELNKTIDGISEYFI